MSIKDSISQMIDKYGSDVTIINNGDITRTKGFVQPLRHKRNMYTDRYLSTAGFTDGRFYLFIGKTDFEFSRNDNAEMICCGKEYMIHTGEAFSVTNKPVYQWAVMTLKKPDREDDYDTP